MGIAKSEYLDHEISVEDVALGLAHLCKWGRKTFKDHTGEWVSVNTSGQLNLFSDEIEAIPHLTEWE
tara:strand:- start:11245 stop:11445 length:201 start_codon:yes stop_codon:yes gene_type:complete